jgi:PAS domain S-box-containing protein
MKMQNDCTTQDPWASIVSDLIRDGTTIIVKSSLKVRDFMRPDPWTLTVNDTLQDSLDIILNRKIDGVPVLDDSGFLVGLVTKTLVLRELSNGRALNYPVKDIMRTNIAVTGPDEDVSTLITVSVGNLLVVDQGRVVGLVTLSDTIRAYFSSVLKLKDELNTIIDSMHNGLISVNEEGNIVLFNTAAETLFQVPRDLAVGKPVGSVVPQSRLNEVMKTGQKESGKLTFQDKLLISNRTPIISNNRIIGAVAVLQDISDLEMISEELSYTKRMKDELDVIIDSSYDGIFVTDGEGLTLRVNDAYCRLIGLPPEELVGRHISDLVKEGVFNQSATLAVLERGERVTISQELKNGNSILVTGNPVFDEFGKIVCVVTNARDITELDSLKQQLKQAETLTKHFQVELNKYKLSDEYVIHDQKMKDLVELSIRLGQVDTTVLVQGESGVGKEVIAKTIHRYSLRNNKPLISINCAAIPESLLESELFGYAPGAFTGAKKNGKAGIFEIAHQGTLFLDEVGELAFHLQSKLLRVIQHREITRIGSTTPVRIDVRLIAATNRDLWEMVLRKEFRRDLFYRLNVVPLYVPPLRERKEEIPFLAAFYLKKFNNKYGFNKQLDGKAVRSLMNYDWPGNVRELENLIERLIVTCPFDTIKDVGLPVPEPHDNITINLPPAPSLKDAIGVLESHLIHDALNRCGSTRKAALELGVSQPTIVRKAAKYGINLREE